MVPIIGTYPEFSHTADEPAHIAAGMELLDREPSRTNSSIHRSRGLLLLSARIFWARARMARNISSMKVSRSSIRAAITFRRYAPLG